MVLAKDVAEWIEYGFDSKGNRDTNGMLRTIDEEEKEKNVNPINNRVSWFLTEDVANWIEHSKPDVMIKSVDEDEKVKVRPKQSLGLLTNNNEYWFLTEDGLYEVLMQSRKPIAKAFKKEVKQNIKRFKEGVDFIDLKDVGESHNNLGLLQSLGYSKMQVSKAEHIYLLSERGYAKLIKIMDTDLAKDVAEWIEYSNVSKMVSNIDEDEKEIHQLSTLTNGYSATFLTEDGLYEVLNNAKQRIVKFKIIMVVKVGNKLYCLLVYDNFR